LEVSGGEISALACGHGFTVEGKNVGGQLNFFKDAWYLDKSPVTSPLKIE
jgi:hypothetical protein